MIPSHAIHLGTAVSPHDTLESILEPFDSLWLIDPVASTDLALGTPPLGNSLAGSGPVEQSISIGSNLSKGLQHVLP